jgi:hypothetical protein
VRLPLKRTHRYQVHLVGRAVERPGRIAVALLDPKTDIKVNTFAKSMKRGRSRK